MSILIRRYFNRSRCAEELVEEWQIAHNQALVSWDVQELVGECIDLAELTRHVSDTLLDLLYDEKVDDVVWTGEFMKRSLQKAEHVFEKAQAMIETLESSGCPPIDNMAKFSSAYVSVQSIAGEFEEQWPTFDLNMAGASLADYQNGNYQTTEDLLSESQSNCSPVV